MAEGDASEKCLKLAPLTYVNRGPGDLLQVSIREAPTMSAAPKASNGAHHTVVMRRRNDRTQEFEDHGSTAVGRVRSGSAVIVRVGIAPFIALAIQGKDARVRTHRTTRELDPAARQFRFITAS